MTRILRLVGFVVAGGVGAILALVIPAVAFLAAPGNVLAVLAALVRIGRVVGGRLFGFVFGKISYFGNFGFRYVSFGKLF
jgi:hypothetical protein